MKIISLILCLLITFNFTACSVNAEEEVNLFKKSIEDVLGKKISEITEEELNQITELDLSNKEIQGEINEDAINIIKNFGNLEKLNLSNNRLYGEIPKEIVNIEGLDEIDFSNNYFYKKEFKDEDIKGNKRIIITNNLFEDGGNSFKLKYKDNFKKEYLIGDKFSVTNISEYVELVNDEGKIKDILENLNITVAFDNDKIIDSDYNFISEGEVNCTINLGELNVVESIKVLNVIDDNPEVITTATEDLINPNPPTITIENNKLVLTDNGDVDVIDGSILKEEDFEDSNYILDFTYGGSEITPWEITNTQRKAGEYSFKNPTIGHSEATSFEFILNVPAGLANPATLSFDYMVSSEDNHDWFMLYVNGKEKLKKSGALSWTNYNLELSPGENIIKFEYNKDVADSSGSDSVYIDSLVVKYDCEMPSLNSGIKNLQYSFDDVNWEIYSCPVDIPTGIWEFKAKTIDNADNESAVVEKISPQINSITGNFSNEGWTRDKNITVNVNGVGSVLYNINDTGWTVGTIDKATINFTNLTSTNLKIKAIDEVFTSLESPIKELNIKCDFTGPAYTTNIISDNDTEVILEINVTDEESGVDYILLPDGSKISDNSATFTIPKDSINNIKVFDKAGNYTLINSPYINSISGNYVLDGWINNEVIMNVSYEKNLMYNLDNAGWQTLGSQIKEISSGKGHSLILLENGDVYSFGYNFYGQLGVGDFVDRNTPTKIDSLSNVKSISSGNGHSLILLENGDVYAFGENFGGKLGLGDTTDRKTPIKINSLSNVKSISAGGEHSLILLENGDVYSFGNNINAQLGLGDTTDRTTPTKIDSLSNVKSISTGNHHSLILLENGDVYSFGNNTYGQLGLGDNTKRNTPTKINSLSNVKSVSAGGNHSLILLENGDVYSFGRNNSGQLGLDDTTNRNTPTKINSLSNVKSISGGGSHSLIVSENGDVYSFGDNKYGQLGLEDTTNVKVPSKIKIMNNSFEIKESIPGMHNYKFKSVDLSTMEESLITEINFGIDFDNPTLILTEVSNAKKEKKYSIQCEDLTSSIDYILLPTGEKIYSNTHELSITTNGIYDITVFDKAGNSSKETLTITDIDNTKPNIPTISKTGDFEATITDNGDVGDVVSGIEQPPSGVKEIQYNYNNEGWKVYSAPLALTFGENIIEAKVIDNAGNESEIVTADYSMDFIDVTLGSNIIDFGLVDTPSTESSISMNINSSMDYKVDIKANSNIKLENSSEEIPISKLSVKLDNLEYKRLSLDNIYELLPNGVAGNKNYNLFVMLDNTAGYSGGKYGTNLTLTVTSK